MTTPLILRMDRDSVPVEEERPAPDRLISGDPVHRTWNLEDSDGLYCGLWQSTPGKWRVSYVEWEYIRILEGVSVLTDADGHETRLVAGDSWIIRPGFEGTWEVIETTLKDYVIRL
ncbi:cupin domain-containing protein [Szabonella alba]|uniref:Cupin domain-containing protein n=1 Tax=Szabonella alba TaxID=2804194 RepID=A0A8K0Y1Q2_9RHOB|nr:cupin domain-containing protein [Szabonella alba]MBL4918122.1 cupin domain-containing protein [Szabonella alba]